MKSLLRLLWCFLACISMPLAARATDEKPDFEKIAPGQTFVLAAPVGTTTDLLGMGFDEQLSEFDAAGNRHRAFASKHKKVPENQYFAQFEQLDNEFKLKAHARFLTSSMNVGFSQEKRYMVLRVYQLKEVATLEPTKPLEAVPLVAQKIFYGWALNVVIEGDLSTFTAEAATELTTAGADIEATVKRYSLKKYVHLVGLEAKNKGHIPVALDPAKFNDEFRVADTPAPIFVEYKVMKELFSPKLSWQRSGFIPGRYRLANVSFKVAETKANGNSWDAMNGRPDPLIAVLIDGAQVDTCLRKDVFEGQCPSEKVVTLTEQSALQLKVSDKDLSEHDLVGTASLDNIMSAGRPYAAIELTTQDSLQSATVTFVPVSGPPPAVAAPAPP
ncbi:hypothetical protein [Hyalangium rubrum]|uniref:Lipoprotein n=1 Tax=Hyalangium rubrum TaxID=3103134 RepID=A0ABU5H3P1_9BACT|nr:hypothetical protein [Hyalangium sp. s54d21]MDY7227412.1 hypothetical protein [Hyalangium sp. s54d21]